MLVRFWFQFARSRDLSLGLGCGVTAYTYEDALLILRDTVFVGRDMPEIEEVIRNVDIRSLDHKHVRNMEPPVWRGVWFPSGYSFPTDR